ncbi:MAG: amidohydrolase family protein [Gaiellales bacterium]
MPTYVADDLSVLPFTHDVKSGPYVAPRLEKVEDSLRKLGVWDRSFTPAQLIEWMDAAGIEKALIPAQVAGTWAVSYETVAELCRDYPDRLYGMAGLDPEDLMEGLRKLERGVSELGFVGAHSYPHWLELPIDDRVFYPFYAKCVEFDVPVQIQVGLAFQRTRSSQGFPAAVDRVAVDFPELKIVCIHTGYPWERELVAVAWKNANVYVGCDTHPPERWAPEIIDYLKGEGREKCIFGTNYPCLDFAEALAQVEELGLDDETKTLLLTRNLRRLYRV